MAALSDPDSPDAYPIVIPELDMDDFGPPTAGAAGAVDLKKSVNRMSRAQFTHMDLASLSEKFGSLSGHGKSSRGGGRLIREESRWIVDGEDVF